MSFIATFDRIVSASSRLVAISFFTATLALATIPASAQESDIGQNPAATSEGSGIPTEATGNAAVTGPDAAQPQNEDAGAEPDVSGTNVAVEETEGGADNDAATTGGQTAETADAEPAEPAPAFLDDPAGAITHLLTQTERDPNLPHDLSPLGMFMMADWVVKAVMILLAVASLAVWTIWLAKTVEIGLARGRARRATSVIAEARNLADASDTLGQRGGPVAFMVRSAVDEMKRSAVALDHAGNDGVKERLGARLARIEAQAGRRLSRGTGLLAIVGSTAPFIGLFGTVWGIMNSFIGISEAQTTNLAVVAPGIAEALLATAIGLVAAIPAVVIYNLFARSIAGYAQMLADAASGVEQLVSLELDLRKVPANDTGSPAKSQASSASSGHAPVAASGSATIAAE